MSSLTATAIDALVLKLHASWIRTNMPQRAGNEEDARLAEIAAADVESSAFALLGGALNDLHSIAHSLDQLSVISMMIMLKMANRLPIDVFNEKFPEAPEQSNNAG